MRSYFYSAIVHTTGRVIIGDASGVVVHKTAGDAVIAINKEVVDAFTAKGYKDVMLCITQLNNVD